MRRLQVALAILSLVLTTGVSAQTYDGHSFGYTVHFPKGAPPCKGGTSDHGFGVFLDRGGKDGCSAPKRRQIIVFTSTIVWTVDKALAEECDAGGGTIAPAPDGLRFTGIKSGACRVNLKDGWIRIFVLAQGGDLPDSRFPNSPSPAHDYVAWLQTNPQHFADDLAAFRHTVTTMQIWPLK